MNKFKLGLLALATIMLVGCGESGIDTSTDEAMQESIAEVRASLPEDKRDEFDESLRTIMFADVKGLADLANTKAIEAGYKTRLQDKTGLEVIAEGKRILAEREEAKQREKISKLDALKSQLASAEDAEEVLKGFVVERSRFFFESSGFMTGAMIEITVVNRTTYPVARVYFEGTLATPGRAIPWVQDTFNHEIRGGLEPGEEATWNLSPNMFGSWSQAPRDRDDMILTVRPIRLDGADGKVIAESNFNADDAKEMQELASTLPSEVAAPYLTALDQEQKQRAAELTALQKIQAERETLRQASQRAEQLRQMKAEVEELLLRKATAQADRSKKEKFYINRSRFYFSDSGFIKQPVIEITVTNETGEPITRVYFEALLNSPGRSTPWLEDTFNYQITGGLEPGEKETWKLSPNMFSDWGKMPDDRNDMVLTLSAYKLEGADGTVLFGTEFIAEDEARLKVLQDQLVEPAE